MARFSILAGHLYSRHVPPTKASLSKLSPKERAAIFAPLTELTAPHLAEMVDILVRLARHTRREPLKERAASRVIELHLLASGQQAEADAKLTTGRVVVIAPAQLDRVEAAHRAAIGGGQ